MKIQEYENYLSKEKTYQINIVLGDDLEASELAECFKLQYPNNKCVVMSAKATQIAFNVILVGLKLNT